MLAGLLLCYMYVSLSGFLITCPDLVLMTSFTCAGSLLADMCTVPFSCIFSASLWYPFMSVSFCHF